MTMKRQLEPNKDLILQSAIFSKQLAYNRYKNIQIEMLKYSFISSENGDYCITYNCDEMNKKLKEAEADFITASNRVNELQCQ